MEESEEARKTREQMENKELEQKLARLETEMAELAKKADAEKAELIKQLETASNSRADEEAAHKATVNEMSKKFAKIEAKIRELEGHPDRWNFKELHKGVE